MRRRTLPIAVAMLTALAARADEPVIAPQAPLRGLDGVTLFVPEPDSSFFDRGITAAVLRAPVELVLREARIPVLDAGDAGSFAGNPVLMVTVNGVLDDGMQRYATRVQLELTQEASLAREPSLVVPDATTWRAGGIALSGPHWRKALLEDVRFYAQRFAEDYWSANGSEEP